MPLLGKKCVKMSRMLQVTLAGIVTLGKALGCRGVSMLPVYFPCVCACARVCGQSVRAPWKDKGGEDGLMCGMIPVLLPLLFLIFEYILFTNIFILLFFTLAYEYA